MSLTDPNKHPYAPTIVAHYQKEMSLEQVNAFSKSPTKPSRFMQFLLEQTPISKHCTIAQRTISHYLPTQKDLEIAHEAGYVKAFTTGTPVGGKNHTYEPQGSGLPWSPELVRQVLYNTASLTSATYGALLHPGEIHFSPSSGFHHATPSGGQGYCTFSGQVIAAVKAWRTHQKRCAWIDLDGHFGNSLPDSVDYCPEVLRAVQRNINPSGRHGDYLQSLVAHLDELETCILDPNSLNGVDYVCVALGADSHEWDAIGGGQCSTDEWIAAADLVFSRLREWSVRLGRPIPVVISLFGGYRDDHPESVLSLHAAGIARAMHWLAGTPHDLYKADVRKPGSAA